MALAMGGSMPARNWKLQLSRKDEDFSDADNRDFSKNISGDG